MDENHKKDLKIVSISDFKDKNKKDKDDTNEDVMFSSMDDLQVFLESSFPENMNLEDIDSISISYTTRNEIGLGKTFGHSFSVDSMNNSDAIFRLLHCMERTRKSLEEGIYE